MLLTIDEIVLQIAHNQQVKAERNNAITKNFNPSKTQAKTALAPNLSVNYDLEINKIKLSQVESMSVMPSVSELVEVIQKERKSTMKKACQMHFPSISSCESNKEQYIFSKPLISRKYKVSRNVLLSLHFTAFFLRKVQIYRNLYAQNILNTLK